MTKNTDTSGPTTLNDLIERFRYRYWHQNLLPYRHTDYDGDPLKPEDIHEDRLIMYLRELAVQRADPDFYARLRSTDNNYEALIRAFPREAEALMAEFEAETRANTHMAALIDRMIELRTDESVTDEDIAGTLAWGPYAEQQLEKTALYRDRAAIDAAGGLKGWQEAKTKADHLGRLTAAVNEALAQEDWLQTMFRVCLNANTAMSFPHLEWLIEEGTRGRIAVISEAEFRIATDRHFYLAGSKFAHPRLGKDDGYRDASSRNSPGMTTTPILAYWPEHELVRTVSRFYLLPNGVRVLPRHQKILDIIQQHDKGVLLEKAKADDALGPEGKTYEYRKEMDGLVREAFVAATLHVSMRSDPDAPIH